MANKNDDRSILRFCAKSLQPNVKALGKSAQQILKRSDIEDIHDLRVASRRIRAVFDSFSAFIPNKKLKIWKKDIRAITKSFGAVRDLDVQLDLINGLYQNVDDRKIQAGLRRIRLRLEQKRQAKQEHTTENTKALIESATIQDIDAWVDAILNTTAEDEPYSPGLFQLGYQQIQNRLDEFLFYEVFIFDSQRVEEMHAMRVTAKQLRYCLEIFSDLYRQETDFALNITRKTQDFLGEIHDCDVWIEFLPKFMEKEFQRIKSFYGYTRPYRRVRPGIEFLIADRQKERERLYRSFLKSWKQWKLNETWLNLRKVIFLTSIETQAHPELESPTENSTSTDGNVEIPPEPTA